MSFAFLPIKMSGTKAFNYDVILYLLDCINHNEPSELLLQVLSRSGKPEVLTNPHRPYGSSKISLNEIRRIREAGGWVCFSVQHFASSFIDKFFFCVPQLEHNLELRKYLLSGKQIWFSSFIIVLFLRL